MRTYQYIKDSLTNIRRVSHGELFEWWQQERYLRSYVQMGKDIEDIRRWSQFKFIPSYKEGKYRSNIETFLTHLPHKLRRYATWLAIELAWDNDSYTSII